MHFIFGASFIFTQIRRKAKASSSPFFCTITYCLSAIIPAKDNFSPVNKLGQGGFGTVYKGLLANDQKIAVKRLSKTSGQGIEEFKNEVALIADAAKKVKVDTEPCVEHKANSKISFEVLCSWCYMSDVLWVLKEWNTRGLWVGEAGNGIPLYAVHGQVKKLEEVGIGRPSTYASTLKVL